ncbi:sulfatase [Acidobacteriota bacterium]
MIDAKKMPTALLLLMGVLIFSNCTEKKPEKTTLDCRSSKCNVIIILVDTLRADHLSCYGSKLDTSPGICQFAEDSVLFTHMFSQSPSTKPSTGSLFTSTYPSQHKCIYNEDILQDNLITLAEILRANQFETHAVNANSVLKAKFNFDQGFASWEDLDRLSADFVNEKVFEKLEAMASPFFLYIHYLDPHDPYMAPGSYYKFFNREYEGGVSGGLPFKLTYFKENRDELEQLKLYYDNEIRYVDDKIAAFFSALKAQNLYDNSLIILLSDHGEMFLEHGFLHHSNGLYNEVIHVPLIIKFPNCRKRNIKVDTYVQTVDIMPTILDVLGIEVEQKLMGDSILSILDKPDRQILCEHLRMDEISPQRALIFENRKLIEDLKKERFMLFDLKSDRYEYKDVLKKNESAHRYIDMMDSAVQRYSRHYGDIEKETTELDENTVEQLKALGYIN